MDRVPQLILAGQTNSTLLGTKAFQETNITDMVSDVLYIITKFKKVITYLKLLTKLFVQHTKNAV